MGLQVAAELDKAAYDEGRPAIHKLQMLADVDRVGSEMSSLLYHHVDRSSRLCLLCLQCCTTRFFARQPAECALRPPSITTAYSKPCAALSSYRTWCSATCTTSFWMEACWVSSGE